jgi:hypothetical protein
MSTRIEDLVKIAPDILPGQNLAIQPGDMSHFAPMGCGLGNPGVVMPWDDLSTALSRGVYYGFTERVNHPIRDAPVTDPTGGTIYFNSRPDRDQFEAVLRLLEVGGPLKTYAAFLAQSDNVGAERFLVQLRIVSTSALWWIYAATATDELQKLVDQPLTVTELLWRFMEVQQQRWGGGYSAQLEGCMGGDGDWAREKLSFGFMVENSYHGVYRIWSRAWLVTK